jgi:uncharacterized membrane protein YgaE (UPF0421/DUF939 family)
MAPLPRLTLRQALAVGAKTAIAAVLLLALYHYTRLTGAAWAVVSAAVVTEPDLRTSLRTGIRRLLANLIGAGTGALVGATLGVSAATIAGGMLAVALACHFARLDAGLKSASASVAIVMLIPEGGGAFHSSVERVLAVLIGCSMALAVSAGEYLLARLVGARYSGSSGSQPPYAGPSSGASSSAGGVSSERVKSNSS